MSKFEVQHFTVCGGWVNTWSVGDGVNMEPQTFETEADAQAELDEYIAERNTDTSDSESHDDYRVVPVGET